jgi:hypothetical protein
LPDGEHHKGEQQRLTFASPASIQECHTFAIFMILFQALATARLYSIVGFTDITSPHGWGENTNRIKNETKHKRTCG